MPVSSFTFHDLSAQDDSFDIGFLCFLKHKKTADVFQQTVHFAEGHPLSHRCQVSHMCGCGLQETTLGFCSSTKLPLKREGRLSEAGAHTSVQEKKTEKNSWLLPTFVAMVTVRARGQSSCSQIYCLNSLKKTQIFIVLWSHHEWRVFCQCDPWTDLIPSLK